MQKFSLNEVIEMAVQIEKSGYTYYNKAIERKDLDEESKSLLTFLRDEEIQHEKIFTALRDHLDDVELDQSQDWDVVSSYLQAIVDSRIFSSPSTAIQSATKAENITEILLNAISFEKDTLLYFHAINDQVHEGKAKSAIRKIINEEISHVRKLSEFRDQLLNS